jgi:hypothetical protein
MKTTKNKLYLLFLIVPFYFCCRKVINVNLNNAAAQIVILGTVTNAPGPYQVKITQTVPFSNDNVFPPVSGAVVKITDNTAGLTDVLTETDSGVYTTSLIARGVPGHTYQLNVTALGQNYTATSTMPQATPLDSITFQHLSNFGKLQLNAQPNFQDPPGIANYYTFNEWVNSKQIKQTFVFDDRLSDGRYISINLFTDSSYISTGDTIRLDMHCVDKNVHAYFNSLQQASDANGFQSASPTNPISNISNNALGYFSANTVSGLTVLAR